MTPETQNLVSSAFPTVAVLIGILLNNNRLTDVNRRIDELSGRMDQMRTDIRDLIQVTSDRHDANLRRVEEVLDARPKHLEEREH